AVAILARDADELRQLVPAAITHVRGGPNSHGGRIFYSPEPLGPKGGLAFVYPGSGNDFPGMGRDFARRWPGLLVRQDAENQGLRSQYLPDVFWDGASRAATVQQRIFAQVAVGSLVTDLLLSLGLSPSAAIGYSLGESSALFGLRAWRDRDGML